MQNIYGVRRDQPRTKGKTDDLLVYIVLVFIKVFGHGRQHIYRYLGVDGVSEFLMVGNLGDCQICWQPQLFGERLGQCLGINHSLQQSSRDLPRAGRTAFQFFQLFPEAFEVLAALDFSGQRSLVRGGQQADPANLAQVHTDGVVQHFHGLGLGFPFGLVVVVSGTVVSGSGPFRSGGLGGVAVFFSGLTGVPRRFTRGFRERR